MQEVEREPDILGHLAGHVGEVELEEAVALLPLLADAPAPAVNDAAQGVAEVAAILVTVGGVVGKRCSVDGLGHAEESAGLFHKRVAVLVGNEGIATATEVVAVSTDAFHRQQPPVAPPPDDVAVGEFRFLCHWYQSYCPVFGAFCFHSL